MTRFYVQLRQSNLYSVTIEADTPEDARDRAEQEWLYGNREEFEFERAHIDYLEASEVVA